VPYETVQTQAAALSHLPFLLSTSKTRCYTAPPLALFFCRPLPCYKTLNPKGDAGRPGLASRGQQMQLLTHCSEGLCPLCSARMAQVLLHGRGASRGSRAFMFKWQEGAGRVQASSSVQTSPSLLTSEELSPSSAAAGGPSARRAPARRRSGSAAGTGPVGGEQGATRTRVVVSMRTRVLLVNTRVRGCREPSSPKSTPQCCNASSLPPSLLRPPPPHTHTHTNTHTHLDC
jgi:hypothetical protein